MVGRGIRRAARDRILAEAEDRVLTLAFSGAHRFEDDAAVFVPDLDFIGAAEHVLRYGDAVLTNFHLHGSGSDRIVTNYGR